METGVQNALNKLKFRMDIATVTGEYTPGSWCNSENPWDLPLAVRSGPIPMHCMQSNCVFPIKHIRSLNLLDWPPESPQQHCYKARRTMMSLQEHKIFRCTPNQIKMRPISLALAPWPSLDAHHTEQVAWLPLGNSRDSLRKPSQV